MRRVASFFTARRADSTADPPPPAVDPPAVIVSGAPPFSPSTDGTRTAKSKRQSKFFLTSSRLNVSTTPLSPHSAHDYVNSASSASSTGSADLRTPDDDGLRAPGGRPWMNWLKRRKSSSKLAVEQAPDWDGFHDGWRPPPPPVLHVPPAGRRSHLHDDDSDPDDLSSESEDDEPEPAAPPPRAVLATTVAHARRNLRISIVNSLSAPETSQFPLLNDPNGTFFPRSGNPLRLLSPPRTLEIALHKRRLLHHLDHETLTPAQEQSIAPIGHRPKPPLVKHRQSGLDSIDTCALPQAIAERLGTYSHGLSQWISRPCFEDRFMVYLPSQDGQGISCVGVSGSGFAVAALEFSEGLEALAGFVGGPQPSATEVLLTPPMIPSPAAEVHPAFHLSRPASPPHDISPALTPLENRPPKLMLSSASIASIESVDSPPSVMTVKPPVAAVKPAVHFAENEKEDNVPLGYVMRVKKQREEKALFLLQQEERRRFMEEKVHADEERAKRDAERREWERERRAWEREKRAMEEERKAKLYAEEVAAARERRESQRAGMVLSSSSGSLSSLREKDRGKTREASSSSRLSRPAYDTESRPRQASDPTGAPVSPQKASPSSSRPSSMVGSVAGSQPRAPQMTPSSSRPASLGGFPSSDSVHSHKRDPTGGSVRPVSTMSDNTRRPTNDRAQTWAAGSIQQLPPPVPPLPVFTTEMPLLPPVPPFMMQQYMARQSAYGVPVPVPMYSAPPSPGGLPPRPSSKADYNNRRQSNHSPAPNNDRRRSSGAPESSRSHSHSRERPRTRDRDRDRDRRSSRAQPSPAQLYGSGSHFGTVATPSTSNAGTARGRTKRSSTMA